MSAVCPVCERQQDAGLLCSACCDVLERELGDVAAIVGELDVTLSKQARMELGGVAGLARERWAYHAGASLAADYLVNTLTTWARDVAGEGVGKADRHPAISASFVLLSNIDAIRRHPEVKELHDEIVATVEQARSAADRPANRTTIFVGPCPEQNEEGSYCDGEVYAYFPTEDSRPPRMECRTNRIHNWGAVQWTRAGKRILDRAEARKREAKGAA